MVKICIVWCNYTRHCTKHLGGAGGRWYGGKGKKKRKRRRKKRRRRNEEMGEGKEGENGAGREKERKKESGSQILSQISPCMNASRYLETSASWPACEPCLCRHLSWPRWRVCLKDFRSSYRKTAGTAASSLGKESETPARLPLLPTPSWCWRTWSSQHLWREHPTSHLWLPTPQGALYPTKWNSEQQPLCRQHKLEVFWRK